MKDILRVHSALMIAIAYEAEIGNYAVLPVLLGLIHHDQGLRGSECRSHTRIVVSVADH